MCNWLDRILHVTFYVKLVVSGRVKYVDFRRDIRNNNVFVLLILTRLVWEFNKSLWCRNPGLELSGYLLGLLIIPKKVELG